ncbi:MAG: methionyl-tRNA formyltransferase [Parvularculales bacterium]
MALRIAFMGTPKFAVPTLEKVIEAGHDVAAVYVRPARPAGRSLKITPSPVEQTAQIHGLPLKAPYNFKSEETHKEFAALNVDATVVVAYGCLLPSAILHQPNFGCLNLHPSLLPRWRGAAPVERALMAGDEITGVNIMKMDEGLDTGPVLLSESVSIDRQENAEQLRARLAECGALLMVQALSDLEGGSLKTRPQSENDALYARRIEKSETRLDWSRPAQDLWYHVRGLAPAPGAWFEMNDGERVRVLRAQPVESAGVCGEVLDDAATIACGQGALQLLEVQRAGRKAMTVDVFLRGARLRCGTHLT